MFCHVHFSYFSSTVVSCITAQMEKDRKTHIGLDRNGHRLAYQERDTERQNQAVSETHRTNVDETTKDRGIREL